VCSDLAVAERLVAGAPEDTSKALEAAYYDWWAENDSLLKAGLTGDVYDLRLRLNAAFEKSSNSLSVTPKASWKA
jgi:hypothetical protein